MPARASERAAGVADPYLWRVSTREAGTLQPRGTHVTEDTPQGTVTRLLRQASAGDRDALDELFPLVYEELRALARAQRRRRAGAETLNTTALVHEAYLKLVQQEDPEWRDRAHFRAVAATAMRHILIDYARRARTARRGGTRARLSLDEIERSLTSSGEQVLTDEPELLIVLDEALGRLGSHSERQVRIVECRFFAGMTVPDTAEALGVSSATVKRGWSMARAWLFREMERTLENGVAGGTA